MRSPGRIDAFEATGMCLVLVLTLVVLGFFNAWVYLQTPEYIEIWGREFAWHTVSPYVGYALLGLIMLILGIKSKRN